MAVMKVLELMANSSKSWEDATEKAVKHASKTIKNIRSVNVQNQSAVVKNGKIKEFRVSLKLTFEVL